MKMGREPYFTLFDLFELWNYYEFIIPVFTCVIMSQPLRSTSEVASKLVKLDDDVT